MITVHYLEYMRPGYFGALSGEFIVWMGKISDGINIPRGFKITNLACHPSDKAQFLYEIQKWSSVQP